MPPGSHGADSESRPPALSTRRGLSGTRNQVPGARLRGAAWTPGTSIMTQNQKKSTDLVKFKVVPSVGRRRSPARLLVRFSNTCRTEELTALSVRWMQPTQQHGRRMPSLSSVRTRSICSRRVSAFLTEIVQQIHSLRASGVRPSQRASVSVSAARACTPFAARHPAKSLPRDPRRGRAVQGRSSAYGGPGVIRRNGRRYGISQAFPAGRRSCACQQGSGDQAAVGLRRAEDLRSDFFLIPRRCNSSELEP